MQKKSIALFYIQRHKLYTRNPYTDLFIYVWLISLHPKHIHTSYSISHIIYMLYTSSRITLIIIYYVHPLLSLQLKFAFMPILLLLIHLFL